MHFDMKKKLKTVSVAHIKLHRQFFYALVAQIIGPTLFLILPAAPILAYPIIYAFINYKISWKTGWILPPIGLYPAFDSVAYMLIVTEYKEVITNEYADEYVRSDILNNYGMSINTVPRFIVVPYDVDGLLRMKNLIFLAIGVSMISFHYSIMLFCGLKMHFNMKKELKKFSAPQRKLQRQFFYALVAQSLGPTIFLVLPATPILLSPLMPPQLEISISWQTGYLYTLVGLYPPFDSIAFMTIVTEYKKVIKKKVAELVSSNQDATHSISNRVQLKRI